MCVIDTEAKLAVGVAQIIFNGVCDTKSEIRYP